jgi:hypothetical protein
MENVFGKTTIPGRRPKSIELSSKKNMLAMKISGLPAEPI